MNITVSVELCWIEEDEELVQWVWVFVWYVLLSWDARKWTMWKHFNYVSKGWLSVICARFIMRDTHKSPLEHLMWENCLGMKCVSCEHKLGVMHNCLSPSHDEILALGWALLYYAIHITACTTNVRCTLLLCNTFERFFSYFIIRAWLCLITPYLNIHFNLM